MPHCGTDFAPGNTETDGPTVVQIRKLKMFKMMIIAGLGGMIGTCLRYLTGQLARMLGPTPYPWGTFIVNLTGSFLIGIFLGWAEKNNFISAQMNVFLVTGLCGGLTTFSSFADDIYLLMQQRHFGLFGLYLVGTLVLGVLLVWFGRALVRVS